MKILFLTYHGFEESSGITKKMQAQIKGLRQNGHEVHVCTYDKTSTRVWCRFVDDDILKEYGHGKWGAIRQRVGLMCVFDYCVSHGIEFVYVRHFMNANPWTLRLFRRLKGAGICCVMEVPTYPYDHEFHFLPFKHKLSLFFDKLFRRQLASQMAAIVTFSDDKTIFGQRTINISNGIDLDMLPLHEAVDCSQDLHLIGVAEVHPWHGFDRLIAGLGEYFKRQASVLESQRKKVYFHIVGYVWPSEMNGTNHVPGFASLIKQYGIEEYVIFHGRLFGDALTDVFNQCQFAIGSLARHRSGITHIKTLKNREYAGRGIPFIYSECDSDFDGQPYVLKAMPDESPIDIQSIVDFLAQLDIQPIAIRNSVEKLSWKYQMQIVLDQCEKLGCLNKKG